MDAFISAVTPRLGCKNYSCTIKRCIRQVRTHLDSNPWI
jgi:hypothetical protein